MKKIFKKGFTFIELLIVITIIGIISFFSFGSFFDFLKNKEFAIKINNLENIIKEEDLKVNNKEIFDYEIIFEKNKDYFKIFENNYSIGEKITLENIGENNISFKIKEKIFSKETISDEEFFNKNKKNNEDNFFKIFIYKNGKFKENIGKNIGDLSFNIVKNNNYDFLFKTFLENNLNNISIKKYDLEEEIVLKEISDSKEKINKSNSVKIENIFGRKKIYTDGNLVKKVYLFFEDKNGKEFYFLIKN